MPMPWSPRIRTQQPNWGPPSQGTIGEFQAFYEAANFSDARRSFQKVLQLLQIDIGHGTQWRKEYSIDPIRKFFIPSGFFFIFGPPIITNNLEFISLPILIKVRFKLTFQS